MEEVIKYFESLEERIATLEAELASLEAELDELKSRPAPEPQVVAAPVVEPKPAAKPAEPKPAAKPAQPAKKKQQ